MGICLFALVLLLTSHMFINEEIEALSSHVEKLSAEMVGADEGLTGASEERKKKNNGEPAKILVFGMHHSGTSGVVRLLAEMGAWAGKRDDLLMRGSNPLKYWEHKRAVEADKLVMNKGTPQKYGLWWVNYGFSRENVPESSMKAFKRSASKVVRDLENGAKASGKSAWVLKDPRICPLAPEWLDASKQLGGDAPVCVLLSRDPLKLAQRMLSYNTVKEALSVSQWVQVWEEFMVRAIDGCRAANAPIVVVSHKLLATEPYEATSRLHEALSKHSVFGLKHLSKDRVHSVLGAAWVSGHQWRSSHASSLLDFERSAGRNFMSSRARELWGHLKDAFDSSEDVANGIDALVSKIDMAASSWENIEQLIELRDSVNRQAYVTMVSSIDLGYASGTKVLAATIRTFDANRQLVAMVTQEAAGNKAVNALLKAGGWKIVEVPKLKEPWFRVHPKCNKFNPSQVIRWGRMFSKLNLWTLGYEKAVYVDTDTLLLQSIEDYFDYPGPFYGERSPSHRGINAGILVVEPSQVTMDSMLKYAKNNEPMQFWPKNQVGCTEQELLNQYWVNGWGELAKASPAHVPGEGAKINNTRHADYISKRFTQGEARRDLKHHGARIAHWITTKCPKPWAIKVEELTGVGVDPHKKLRKICDPKMYLLWHSYYWSLKSAHETGGSATSSGLPMGLQKNAPVQGMGRPAPFDFKRYTSWQ